MPTYTFCQDKLIKKLIFRCIMSVYRGCNMLITKEILRERFIELGVMSGDVVYVESDSSKLGYVIGGSESVVEALMEVVGENGTIVMSLKNIENQEPSYHFKNVKYVNTIELIRQHIPAFQASVSSLNGLDAVVQQFRRYNLAVVSSHPSEAVIAWGKQKQYIVEQHPLNFPHSEVSPYGKLYQLNAKVLLIGCDYSRINAFHLAAHISKLKPVVLQGCAMLVDHKRVWKKYLDLELSTKGFMEVGRQLELKNMVKTLKVQDCEMKLFKLRDGVLGVVNYLIK